MLRVQKTLEDANIKLDSVLSDLMGKSGRAMLEALIAGETNPVAKGSKSLFALAVVVGIAVPREGSEVALFLYGVAASDGNSAMSLLSSTRRSRMPFDLFRLAAYSAARTVCHHDRAHYVACRRHGRAGSCVPRTCQLVHCARHGRMGHWLAAFGRQYPRPHIAHVDRLYRSAYRDAACDLRGRGRGQVALMRLIGSQRPRHAVDRFWEPATNQREHAKPRPSSE